MKKTTNETEKKTYYHGYLYYYNVPIGPADLTQDQMRKVNAEKGYHFQIARKITVYA